MNWFELKARIVQALATRVGEREAINVAAYYADARRAVSDNDFEFEKDLDLLVKGIPVQQVVSLSFFYGHKFYVDNRVLIPRPETEELVHWILTDHKRGSTKSILDVGVGSGCILLSILAARKSWKGYGIDISDEALEVARHNADAFEIACSLAKANILEDDLTDYPQFDLIISNPPYILDQESAIMSASTLKHEPHIALFVEGTDPLIFYKRLIELAQKKLKKDGQLYLETSHLHWDEMIECILNNELKYHVKKDLQGNNRMLKIEF